MPFINNNKKNLYNLENHKPGDIKYFPRIYDQFLPGLYSQVGSTCDRYGSVVSISDDGDTIAVGSPYYSDTSDEGTLFRTRLCGMVKIYKFDGVKWNMKGAPILGPKKDYMLGISIDMNNSGTKIIIGSAALEYGPSRYIDYFSSPDIESSSKEIYDTAKQGYDVLKTEIETAVALGGEVANVKGAAMGGVAFFANVAIDQITKGRLEKEPDVLLSIQQNSYFDDGISPEGNGYPDNNIRGRGNVRIYEWLNGEWYNTLSFDGEEYNIETNYGSSVAIARNSGETIAIGAPRFSIAERYRERKDVADWVIVLKVLQQVGNLVLTAVGGPAGAIIFAIEQTVDGIMKALENTAKVDGIFLQREKYFKYSMKHLAQYYIEAFDPAPYRTNHIIYRNMGQIDIHDIKERNNYKRKTFWTQCYVDEARTKTISPAGAFIIKEQKKQGNIKTLNTHIGDRIGDSYYGSVIAMSGDGRRVVTFNYNDKSISTSINANNFIEPIFIGDDYDLRKVVLSMSGDGRFLAVGLPYHSITWQSVGVVLLFKWHDVGGGWWRFSSNDDPALGGVLLRGSTEEPGGDMYGNSVALNYNGTVLAVGSPFSNGLTAEDKKGGNVKVYKWNSQIETWETYGSTIYGTKDNLLGTSIKLSYNGNTIVIGAPCRHQNSDYFTSKPTIYKEFTRTHKYTYKYRNNTSASQLAYRKKYEKTPNTTTSSFIETSNDGNDYKDTAMPYSNITDDTLGITPDIYGDPAEADNGTSYKDYKSKYYNSTTKTVKKTTIGGENDPQLEKTTEWMIYQTIIKKRKAILNYDEGQYGFVKVFRFINGDWNQNCNESTESTDIRLIPPIPPEAPISSTEMSGLKIFNLYLDTEYVDPGIKAPYGYTLDETISDINLKRAGNYNISYIIKNRRGHVTRFDRDVNIIRRPTINNSSPVIVLKGDIFNKSDNYGLWLEGQVDEVISLSHDVNTDVEGDYSIIYNVAITKNIYKSEIIALKRDVKVISKKIITINGGTQVVRQFNKYKDLGATVKDTYNNILSPKLITTTILFSTANIGTYYVTYSAEYGTSVTRKVIVTSPYVKSMQSLLNDISISG